MPLRERIFAALYDPFIFLEHVRASDPRLVGWHDRFERPWGWTAGGCHPNRPTLDTIASTGFELAELEQHDDAPLPHLVRPLVGGTAV